MYSPCPLPTHLCEPVAESRAELLLAKVAARVHRAQHLETVRTHHQLSTTTALLSQREAATRLKHTAARCAGVETAAAAVVVKQIAGIEKAATMAVSVYDSTLADQSQAARCTTASFLSQREAAPRLKHTAARRQQQRQQQFHFRQFRAMP
jgi:hypothetical protein